MTRSTRQGMVIVTAMIVLSVIMAGVLAEVITLRSQATTAEQLCAVARENRQAIRQTVHHTADVGRALLGSRDYPGRAGQLAAIDRYERTTLAQLVPVPGCQH